MLYTKRKLAVAVAVALLPLTATHALDAMTDEQMGTVTGKEMIKFTSIGPNELGNPNNDVGFYRLTLNGQVDINANIKALRLGCDSPNPTSNTVCDINIDNLSLTGMVPSVRTGYAGNSGENTYTKTNAKPDWQNNDTYGKDSSGAAGVYNPNTLRDSSGNIVGLARDTADTVQRLGNTSADYPVFGSVNDKLAYTKGVQSTYFNPANVGPITDFVMKNSFFEFAIQHPDDLAKREVVGYRFGAEEAWGVMSTGSGPVIKGTTIAAPVEIIGPNGKSYGSGVGALDELWVELKAGTSEGSPERAAAFEQMKQYVNDSVERGHTGVNYISGRLPVQIDNLNVNARVYDAHSSFGTLQVNAQTAIVAGRLSRQDNTDFGRLRNPKGSTATQEEGYLRNTYLGDRDTIYDPNIYGNYVANKALVGRAQEFKRNNRALLENMIVTVHNLKPDGIIGNLADLLGGADELEKSQTGDRFNTQDISTKVFHQLQYGLDKNGNGRYDAGEAAKHMAFQYQSLDGLQWITTDRRFGSQYDDMGNVVAGTQINANGADGYDWLSTRAGFWLESPMAIVKDTFVPRGQTINYGSPDLDKAIQLMSLDLGKRAVDNCYGGLTFC